MKLQPAVRQETIHIAAGCAVGCAVMLAVFAALGRLDYTVALGAGLGWCLAVANFLLLGLSVQKAAGESESRAKAMMQTSYTMRNLMCALVQESVALLRGCGFSQREALDALAPLMRANLAHLLQVGPQQALTGPVERGDTATVAKHLACLTGEDARQVYRGASRMLVELARNKHPDIDAESMNEILKEGSNR